MVVDNVFATPVFSEALAQGADVVIYSATKHIDGQGRALGGVILGSTEFIRKTVEPYMKHTGGSMSPFTAWVMLKGLETLSLRVNAPPKVTSTWQPVEFLGYRACSDGLALDSNDAQEDRCSRAKAQRGLA